MEKKTIKTDKAPAAIGPYSQAVQVGNTIYLSGQIPLNPDNMEVVEGGIKEQTERVMQNLSAVLKEAGGDLASVVKTTVYMIDLSDFAEMNEVYAKFMGQNRPARATVEVAALPKGVMVEVEAVAVLV